MVNANGDSVIICSPKVKEQRVMMRKCPTCNKKRKMFGFFQEWYGWHITCLGCGDQWQDGEMLERPFMPRWRKENIESARRAMCEKKEK